MPLPKVQYPSYHTTIPSSGETIKFRPFTVKEEKVLLTALQGGDELDILNSTKEVIKACYFEKVDVDSIASYDIEFLFLQLRMKSISEIVELEFRNQSCPEENGQPCKKSVKMAIDLTQVTVQQMGEEGSFEVYDPKGRTSIGSKVIIDDNLGVTMTHPGVEQIQKAESQESDYDQITTLVKECITSVFDENEVVTRNEFAGDDLDDFYDSLLTKQKQKLIDFVTNIPKVRYESKFKCRTCGYEEPIIFEGLNSFFG